MYFVAWIAKLELGDFPGAWILYNYTGNLLLAATNYWRLSRVDSDILFTIAQTINQFRIPINSIVIISELAWIYLLSKDKIHGYTFITLTILLHVFIVISSWVFFRDRIILLLGRAFLILNKEKIMVNQERVLFMGMVLLSPIIFLPPSLAWRDTSYTIVYEVMTETDEKIWFEDLSPYDLVFTQNRFHTLDNQCTYAITTYWARIENKSKHIYSKAIEHILAFAWSTEKMTYNKKSIPVDVQGIKQCTDLWKPRRNESNLHTMNTFLL
jgi:hypothetical protein